MTADSAPLTLDQLRAIRPHTWTQLVELAAEFLGVDEKECRHAAHRRGLPDTSPAMSRPRVIACWQELVRLHGRDVAA